MKPNRSHLNPDFDRILNAREERAKTIQECLDTVNAVVSIKANIPGADKHVKEAFLLVRYFANHFRSLHPAPVIDINNPDGPGVLFCYELEIPERLKNDACHLEEQDDWGRFIDIDVYSKAGVLSREKPRKCLICNEPAFDCIRNGRHPEAVVMKTIKAAILERLPKMLESMIWDSIRDELDLDPKFGLVTPLTSGSHPDMDHHLMLDAAEAIIPYLVRMGLMGWEAMSLEGLLPNIRKLGIQAERAMLEATGGINAYKGLIFSLGLMVTAAGYRLGKAGDNSTLFQSVSKMTAGITQELEVGEETFGKKAFRLHQLTGARGEAEQGFPSVQKALMRLKSVNRTDRLRTLLFLIGQVEDTILWKRAGSWDNYQEIKALFANWTDLSEATLASLSQDCIEKGFSFGGSADLLVVSCFCRRFCEAFSFQMASET